MQELSPELLTALEKAWRYWQEDRNDLPYYGFKEWLKAEYGIATYSRAYIKFTHDQGKLLFWLRWV